jgi:hypothetical protein
MLLLPLSVHSANLSRILREPKLGCEWASVAEWLQIVASVKSVDLDIIQYDSGFGNCFYPDEYALSCEELLKHFVTRITIFNFAWGALESFINIIKPPKNPEKSKRGKIRDACYLMKLFFHAKQMLPFLLEETACFRFSAQKCFGHQNVEMLFKDTSSIGLPGIGLFCVYELRNSFAHGSLSFPQPDEENSPLSSHNCIMVDHATRVVLISLQMLLLAYFKDSEQPISFAWNPNGTWQEYTLSSVLRCCHMDRKIHENQMFLF